MVGSSHASRVIHLPTAGECFLVDEDVVKLDVETVEATEAAVVVSVWGIVPWVGGGACG